NIAALGAHVGLIGVVGADEPGRQVRRLAGEAMIDAHLVEDQADMPTTLKMRVLGRQQQLLRVDFEQQPGAQALAAVDSCVGERIAQYDMLVLSDYAKGALAQVDALIAVARRAG